MNKQQKVTFLLLLATGFAVFSFVVWGLKQSTLNGVYITACLVLFFSGLFLFVEWLMNKKNAGNLLLDITDPSERLWIFLVCIGSLLLALFTLYTYLIKQDDFWFIFAIFLLLLNTISLFMALIGNKTFECGLMVGSRLIKWENIESFDWAQKRKKGYILLLKYKKIAGFLNRNAPPFIKVPFEKKTLLENIIVQHLANRVYQ